MASEEEADGGEPTRRAAVLRRVWRRCMRWTTTALGRILDCVDVVIKVVGPLFILLALALFGFEAYTFFVLVLPSMVEEGMPLVMVSFLGSSGIFLLVNLLYNYAMAICLDPGLPPEFDSKLAAAGKSADAEAGEQPAPKQCQRCQRLKPPRCHHCSVCRRCVLKMDHHCPWINNCVGFNNYRYFCLFLLYLAACCLFIVLVFMQAFLDTMLHPRKSTLDFFARQCVSLCWIIAFCIFLALCGLGGFHLYLVLTNQTTIEFHTNLANKAKAKMRGEYYRNPYDLGRRRNFQQVFGPNDVCRLVWLLPYVAKRPTGDGLRFPSLSELRL